MNTFDLPSNSNYGDQPIPITFPENWDVHISKIHGYDTPALTEAQIAEKIHAAIGAKPISEGAAGKKSAVIIIDDITRPTPCEPIAKAVIAELRAAGVPKENIWFIIALGTHGVMYRTEFVRKLGEEIVENYEVHNHNLFFNHVFVGNTTNNVPVEINADVMSADYKIAIGTTMAHSYYGFSGGAKCILPGVSSLRTIMRNHSFTTTTEFNMGNPHTLMRSDAEQAARMMGLDFKIDAILNGHAQICNLFAGDFEAEIQHAAAYAAEHYAAKFVPDCDVVIANNYFKPAEANCAYTPEVIASLKDGGSFVLAANSPFGVRALPVRQVGPLRPRRHDVVRLLHEGQEHDPRRRVCRAHRQRHARPVVHRRALRRRVRQDVERCPAHPRRRHTEKGRALPECRVPGARQLQAVLQALQISGTSGTKPAFPPVFAYNRQNESEVSAHGNARGADRHHRGKQREHSAAQRPAARRGAVHHRPHGPALP